MLIYALIVAAVLARFLPHAGNFAPVTAMVLFSAAYLNPKRLWVPMLAIIASDFVLTPMVYKAPVGIDQYFTWGAYLLIFALGSGVLRGRVSAWRVGGAAVASSLVFFLVSNFGTWVGWTLYPHTWAGLAQCYIAGIPFYRMTLASDLLFSAAFFGSYEWARRHGWVPSPAGV